MTIPPKFCKAPFTSVVVDKDSRLLPCCEYLDHASPTKPYYLDDYKQWWATGLDQLRSTMVSGGVDNGCAHCINKESNSQQFNLRRWTDQRVPDSAQHIIDQWTQKQDRPPELLEIRLGNLCNLACIMCNPAASSTIAAEYHQHRSAYASIEINAPTIPSDKWWDDHDKWDRLKSLIKHAKYLHFGGGEPFMHPRIVELLGELAKDCRVSFSTNMTRLDRSIGEMLEKFPHARLIASIEGIKAHNDYVRWPSEWHTIEKSFDLVDNKKISIHHVLQHTSVFCLPDLIRWADDRKISMTFGEIYHGSIDGSGMMTLASVSPDDFARFSHWLSTYKGSYRSVLEGWAKNYHFNQDLHVRFCRYTKLIDSIRNTDFTGVFQPRWALAESN